MDDALGMNHHLHPFHFDAEKPVCLDHLKPFVEQGRRIDRDLRAHVPGRMLERFLDRNTGKLIRGRLPKRSAGGGQNNPANFRCAPIQALEDRVVL